jgi:hypothetical protein
LAANNEQEATIYSVLENGQNSHRGPRDAIRRANPKETKGRHV